jgi:putative Holliday junction resolvase
LTVRVLGIDFGRRRIGLAISDRSGTLARPLETLTVKPGGNGATSRGAVDLVEAAIARLAAEEDGLGTIVIGLPIALDGSVTDETARVSRFISMLKGRTMIPIVEVDERLTSREAESRLAVREKDWRKRKAHIDAVAAAVILQDYLDRVLGARD